MHREARGHHHIWVARNEGRHWAVAGVVGAVVSLIGTGVSTYAAVRTSEQQAEAARTISKEKEVEAANIRETAAFEERQQRRRLAIMAGQQQANFAASGFDTSVGTPLFDELDFAKQSELSALEIRRGGAIAAGGRQFEGRIAKYQGNVARAGIPYEIAGGVLSATSTAVNAYGTYKYRTTSRKPTVSSDWTGPG